MISKQDNDLISVWVGNMVASKKEIGEAMEDFFDRLNSLVICEEEEQDCKHSYQDMPVCVHCGKHLEY